MHHGFIDGNKRVGFVATYVFLGMNGLAIDASAKVTLNFVIRNLEACTFSKDVLETWLRKHTSKR
jgi:death-on-curing protein